MNRMRMNLIAGAVVWTLPAATALAQPDVLSTIVNPANNHTYILLSASSWTAANAKAGQLGGTLAVLNDAAEEAFIYDAFSNFDGANRNLWIGLYDPDPSQNSTDRAERRSEFRWVDGTPVNYTNWDSREPNRPGSPEPEEWEYYVHIWYPAYAKGWNNLRNLNSVFGVPVHGVVEVKATPIVIGPDSDGDGIADVEDGCPDDRNKVEPGDCGCGNLESLDCRPAFLDLASLFGYCGGAGLGYLVSFAAMVGWRARRSNRRGLVGGRPHGPHGPPSRRRRE